jgi:hypothetical protein
MRQADGPRSTLGIDLAAESADTGACRIRWEPSGAPAGTDRVLDVPTGHADDARVEGSIHLPAVPPIELVH